MGLALLLILIDALTHVGKYFRIKLILYILLPILKSNCVAQSFALLKKKKKKKVIITHIPFKDHIVSFDVAKTWFLQPMSMTTIDYIPLTFQFYLPP